MGFISVRYFLRSVILNLQLFECNFVGAELILKFEYGLHFLVVVIIIDELYLTAELVFNQHVAFQVGGTEDFHDILDGGFSRDAVIIPQTARGVYRNIEGVHNHSECLAVAPVRLKRP